MASGPARDCVTHMRQSQRIVIRDSSGRGLVRLLRSSSDLAGGAGAPKASAAQA
jgi:hypothetical protein